MLRQFNDLDDYEKMMACFAISGFSINIKFITDMMGVDETVDIAEMIAELESMGLKSSELVEGELFYGFDDKKKTQVLQDLNVDIISVFNTVSENLMHSLSRKEFAIH